jgi:hypothetical protein
MYSEARRLPMTMKTSLGISIPGEEGIESAMTAFLRQVGQNEVIESSSEKVPSSHESTQFL